MCGEESEKAALVLIAMEIPPRVRRRAPNSRIQLVSNGNTSACAEKRKPTTANSATARKYLRVCGEEGPIGSTHGAEAEIPPRVRRRALRPGVALRAGGNTSACAEKRRRSLRAAARCWKYLRVCGEE